MVRHKRLVIPLALLLALSLLATGCPDPPPAEPPVVEQPVEPPVVVPDVPIPPPTTFPSRLISAEWLLANIDQIPNLRIIDLRDEEEYLAGHIPGAVNQPYVGPRALRVTQAEGIPAVRRTIEGFETLMGRHLGISHTDPVVVYAAAGHHAARMLWELNLHGHFDVAVLNGLFPAWVEAGGPVSVEAPVVKATLFVARFQPHLLATNHYIAYTLGHPDYFIIDNRPHPQYSGIVPGKDILNPGHIPNAINWPLAGYLKDGTTFIPVEEFVRLAEAWGITRDHRIVVTCRSGSSSSGLYLMLAEAGFNVANHDHSWISWNIKDYLPRQME